ncbi:MAG: hypothetical protein JXA44_04145 [Methanospirillaceae archaeon]|nr:hypothetical protein [Methanospirillaceae archaeon]
MDQPVVDMLKYLINSTREMDDIENSQKTFYLNKFLRYGDSPKALSWNDEKTQEIRFNLISDLFKHENNIPFSIHEVGCGLAHYLEYLSHRYPQALYSGSDIVPEFLEYNKKKYPDKQFFLDNIASEKSDSVLSFMDVDYYCLNGTFHTKEENSVHEWENFIFKSIKNMFTLAKKGIAFNFLTSNSDYYDSSLYYANPAEIITWCLRNCSRFISIRHDLPLFEFFVYIYKEDFIKKTYPEHHKYFKNI